ncbi:response regulator transcription factor, partial [Bacteroides intestinalis]|uniref:response regulator transcription factor n=1 Tax=Bacteroides intestinalis TaxID=329854 RepID=UPI001EDB235D
LLLRYLKKIFYNSVAELRINKGKMSKDIAQTLSISINTVNRHRQNILEKLQVNNSIEACRIAKELHLL